MGDDNTIEKYFALAFFIGIVYYTYEQEILLVLKGTAFVIVIASIIGFVIYLIIKAILMAVDEGKRVKEAELQRRRELSENRKQRRTEEKELEIIRSMRPKKKVSKRTKRAQRKKPVKSRTKKLTRKAEPRVSINVDEYKGFYRYKDLNLHEIKYLLAKKYQIVDKPSIVSGKVEKFILKPRFNESINHMFVTYDIAEFLENKGIEVQKFITKKPDLVFEIDGKKIAVEVETGTVYDKSRKQLVEKVKELNQKYDYWFFVVTNRNYGKKYRKLGKTIEMRYLTTHLRKVLKTVTEKTTIKRASAFD